MNEKILDAIDSVVTELHKQKKPSDISKVIRALKNLLKAYDDVNDIADKNYWSNRNDILETLYQLGNK